MIGAQAQRPLKTNKRQGRNAVFEILDQRTNLTANQIKILAAAIVGDAGELEHAAAILHPKLGKPLRAAVEKGAALVPSAKKRAGIGAPIDVPLGHKDAAFVRSHFDAMEVRVSDAPRPNEILVAVVVTDSGRPLPRIVGLQVSEIEGKDGLR